MDVTKGTGVREKDGQITSTVDLEKQRFDLPDIIDLEYFIHLDEIESEKGGDDGLKERDRRIYKGLEKITGVKRASHPERFYLLMWLSARRRQLGQGVILPGRIWDELYRLFKWALFISGLVSGGGLAFSVLSYHGKTPVNVFLFLSIFVFLQMGLFLISGLGLLFHSRIKGTLKGLFIADMLRHLFSFLFEKVVSSFKDRMPYFTVSQMKGALSAIFIKKQIYGSLFLWPFFILVQLFALGFNVGALSATLLKVAGSDLAFGWQTTLQIGPKSVYLLVKVLALPWSWLFPEGTGYPSLSQIEGTRMVLKEGIYHLATRDLTSWWPFLCLCILFYAIFPRLLLIFWAKWNMKRQLLRLEFNQAPFRKVIRRMITPLVDTKAEVQPQGTLQNKVEDKKRHRCNAQGFVSQDVERTAVLDEKIWGGSSSKLVQKALLLVPDELLEETDINLIEKQLSRLGFKILGVYGFDEAMNVRNARFLKEIKGPLKDVALVILQEAWQPPVEEFLSFLKAIRGEVKKSLAIVVLLSGMPLADGGMEPVKDSDFKVWKNRLFPLSDPNLEVIRL